MLLFYLFPNVLSLPDNKSGLVGKIQDEKIGIPSIGKTERRIFLSDSFTAVSRSRFYHGITNYNLRCKYKKQEAHKQASDVKT